MPRPLSGNGLKVLFAADRLSARGGADRHLLGILDRLRDRPGVKTLLAVGFDDGSLPENEKERTGPRVRLKGLDRSGLGGRGRKAALERLEDLAASFKPDLIHLQNIMDPAIIRCAAGIGPGLATIQDHRFFCPGRGKLTSEGRPCTVPMGPGCLSCFADPDYGQRMSELTRTRLEALKGLKKILVLSDYMGQELARAGLDPGSIRTLPPFVHALEEPPRANVSGYHLLACRLVERKGVRLALEAARMLRGPLGLVVAGDGPLAGEVRAAAVRGLVRYQGWADRKRMGELLHGAASLWLPGLWAEPFGIVGLEALALGVPVISTRVGGVAQWFREGENGLAVAPGDPAGLAAAADRLAGDRALASELSRRGRKGVLEKFRPESLMDALMNTYSEIR